MTVDEARHLHTSGRLERTFYFTEVQYSEFLAWLDAYSAREARAKVTNDQRNQAIEECMQNRAREAKVFLEKMRKNRNEAAISAMIDTEDDE